MFKVPTYFVILNEAIIFGANRLTFAERPEKKTSPKITVSKNKNDPEEYERKNEGVIDSIINDTSRAATGAANVEREDYKTWTTYISTCSSSHHTTSISMTKEIKQLKQNRVPPEDCVIKLLASRKNKYVTTVIEQYKKKLFEKQIKAKILTFHAKVNQNSEVPKCNRTVKKEL